MTRKEKLYYLLDNYKDGQYDTKTFCDVFVEIYALNTEDKNMTAAENAYMQHFCRLAERFSPYKEDLLLDSYFVDEKTFQKIFEELYSKLILSAGETKQEGLGDGFYVNPNEK